LLTNLLFWNTEVAKSNYGKVVIISAIAAIVLIVFIAILCFANRKGNLFSSVKDIVFAGLTISASFALSFLKFTPVQYGGSITLASFVPILIYAYVFGFARGALVGLIYGLLQFIQDAYLLTPVTFLLDYLLAFSSIAFMSVPKHFIKNTTSNVLTGTLLVYAVRFIMHLVSGFIYFAHGAVWANIPTPNAFIYSALYQLCYLPADMAICMIIFFILCKTNTFDRLVKMIKR